MREIWTTLLRTLLEAVDSKKAMAALSSALASSFILLAGRQGWTWLTPDTSNLIAGAITAHAVPYVLAQAHVDRGAAQATPSPTLSKN